MLNFSKTTLLIIFLIVFFLAAGFFTYQWWQIKGEEELEVVEEKVINETANWKTYRNDEIGFEIRLPPEWDYYIIDRKYTVRGSFRGENVRLMLRINMFTEITPSFFPSPPWCYNEGEFIILEKNKLPKNIVSTFQRGVSEEECDEFLLDEHLIYSRFCIDKQLMKAYPAKLGRNGEYFFFCEKEGTLYNFELFCENKKWLGKEGRNKCNQLFDQILSTFKVIKD